MKEALLNGCPAKDIDILDRGMHYGDGVFETIAVINKHPLCWHEHINRLTAGCASLKIDFSDANMLQSEMLALCQNYDRAVLKIIITGGSGGRGYHRYKTTPNRLLAIHPWPQYPAGYTTHGSNIQLCYSRLGHNPKLAGIKHLNRLEQVLARNEWHDSKIIEGLMLDIDGNVIEGTMSNIFVVNDDKQLLTPDISRCGINGVVRQYILNNCASFGYKSEVCNISLDDIYAANEIFFCNSIMGILPVKRLADHQFPSQLNTHRIRQILVKTGVII